jgi:hypothetical protein
MEIRWTPGDDLQRAIRLAFNESPREEIYRIDVDRDGIKAYFKIRNVTQGG